MRRSIEPLEAALRRSPEAKGPGEKLCQAKHTREIEAERLVVPESITFHLDSRDVWKSAGKSRTTTFLAISIDLLSLF